MTTGTTPDLIIRAKNVHTMAPDAGDASVPTPDDATPSGSAAGGIGAASAIAVTNGVITAIGDRSEIDGRATSATRIIDVPGTVVPGFTDAHAHPMMSLSMTRGANLTACKNQEQVIAALRAEDASSDSEEWVLAWGLDPNVFADEAITNSLIHRALGAERKAFVSMFDAHSAIASDAALAAAGIAEERTYPGNSSVVVDHKGRPTGHLLEFAAMEKIREIIPALSFAEQTDALVTLLTAMAVQGITAVHVMDMNDPETIALLTAAEERGLLPVKLRFSPWCAPTTTDEQLSELIESQGRHGERWCIGGAKLFIDGTVEGGTAWLETPDSKGESTTSAWGGIDDYAARVRELNAAGVPTATHAIGERGIREVVETLAALPKTGVQHRIEHIESVAKDVIDQMGAAGIAASMQPAHCTHYTAADGSDDWSQRLGEVRAARAWCTRDVIDAGGVLALGSDYPVAPFEVLPIMADAQLRRPVEEAESTPVLPEQGLTPAEVLAGYTTEPFSAIGEEGGFLAVGAPATFTVLDVDPLAVEPEELGQGQVLLTVSEGIVTHHVK